MPNLVLISFCCCLLSILDLLKSFCIRLFIKVILPSSGRRSSNICFFYTVPELIILVVDFTNWKSKLSILSSSFQAFDEKKLNYAELGKGNQLFLRGSPRMCNRIIATAPPNVSQNPRTMANHQTT